MIYNTSMSFPHINLRNIAREAMRDYGFVHIFPARAMKEIQGLQDKTAHLKHSEELRDLRGLVWSSIDNIDSRDLDQIEYCESAGRREIRVLVAVADVDFYVVKATGLDRHAAHNGTSVYTGIETFPLFPQKLSWDLSSLNENEDRVAVVSEFFVRRDGSVCFADVYRALVRNKAKLVYETAGDWLEEKTGMPEAVLKVEGLEDQLLLQNQAAERLHQFRMENGALELETIEPMVLMQEGRVVDLIVKKKNAARYLIENFMIAANRTMVWFLEKNKIPLIQRIVRTPEKWLRIVEVAKELGVRLPELPDSKALSDFLAKERRRDPEVFPDLSVTVVKLIGSGEYVMVPPGKSHGHFGLAVSDYTHSTAPNRRYVDLIMQRLLKAVLSGKNFPYNKTELSQIAEWCTTRDQASKKVERFMRKVAGAILLSDRIGEVFEGIVTGASEKGVYVRLLAPPVEGRVVQKEEGLEVGQKTHVRLINMRPHKGYIDFERVERSGE